MTRDHAAGSTSAESPQIVMPAAVRRMSAVPSCSRAAANAASTDAASVTSTVADVVATPVSSARRVAEASTSGSRSRRATLTPAVPAREARE